MSDPRITPDLIDRVNAAWRDDLWPTRGYGPSGRGIYIRDRSDDREDGTFVAIAGPFATDEEAEAEIKRVNATAVIRVVLEAIE